MKVLMLVNWDVHNVDCSDGSRLPPNVLMKGERYWFFRHWPDQNLHVDVIDYSRLPLIHALEKKFFRFYAVQALRALLRSRGYDLMVSHGAQSAVLLALFRSVLGKSSPPHLVIDVGSFNGGRNNPIELLPIRQAVKSLSGIIYHAHKQKDYYKECLPHVMARTRFVPFGIDTDFFKPTYEQGEGYIISVGYAKRDWQTLVNAFNLTRKKIRLVVVGSTRLGVGLTSDRIRCMPYIPIQELIRLTQRARFVIIPLPYFAYSFGQMTLLQSMAMGKAVIITRVPGVEDYVVDGKTGFFVKPYDPHDLAQKIEYLWDNPEVILKTGQEARHACETDLSEKTFALGIRRAVDELCDI